MWVHERMYYMIINVLLVMYAKHATRTTTTTTTTTTISILTTYLQCLKRRYDMLHPVSITRFPLSRFSPGAGLLRNPFFLHYQR